MVFLSGKNTARWIMIAMAATGFAGKYFRDARYYRLHILQITANSMRT